MPIIKEYSQSEIKEQKELAQKSDVNHVARVAAIDTLYEEIMQRWDNQIYVGEELLQRSEFGYIVGRLESLAVKEYDVSEWLMQLAHKSERHLFAHSGMFISGLVQSAYMCGGNDFVIPTRLYANRVFFLGTYLNGTYNDPLTITIDGDVGIDSLLNISYVNAHITGDCEVWAGSGAYESQLRFDGKQDAFAGLGAMNSTLIFKTYAGQDAAHKAVECDIYVPKKIRDPIGRHSVRCAFIFEDYSLRPQIEKHTDIESTYREATPQEKQDFYS